MGFEYVGSYTEVFTEIEIHDWEKPVVGELLYYNEDKSTVYVNTPSRGSGLAKNRKALEDAYLTAFKTAWEKRSRKLEEMFGDTFSVATDILGTDVGWDANESFEIGIKAARKATKNKDYYIYFHGKEDAKLHTEDEYAEALDDYLVSCLGAEYNSQEALTFQGYDEQDYEAESFSMSLTPDRGGDAAFLEGSDIRALYRDIDKQLKETDENAFRTLLFKLIDERGMKDSDVYRRAEIDRKLFSKIRCNDTYHPKKSTVLALGIALELSEEDISDLLLSAGYALSRTNPADLIVLFCINRKIYDLYKINCALYDHGQPILGEPSYAGRDAR